MKLPDLLNTVRELSRIAQWYTPDFLPVVLDGYNFEMRGYGHSQLTLAVHKTTQPPEFAGEQAAFMLFLGEKVCPRILSTNDVSFTMEYLQPIATSKGTLLMIEQLLDCYVWNRPLEDSPFTKELGDTSWAAALYDTIGINVPVWVMDTPCIIHGDPTVDNTLVTKDGHVKIADPIPPHRLVRPSIRAIDHAKVLQSLLGWEVVLRGMPEIEYSMPSFMLEYETARRAVFWCIVALRRIALRNNTCHAGMWAEEVAGRLMQCAL